MLVGANLKQIEMGGGGGGGGTLINRRSVLLILSIQHSTYKETLFLDNLTKQLHRFFSFYSQLYL